MKIGLRVDVDTLRGTRDGVPNLCRLLAAHGIRATFFFSVGPDNMGRHLWRLFKPDFLAKMLRSKAGQLYGWDILLRGTLWPGPIIGKKCAGIIRAAAKEGHEAGLHAWDHHKWQAHIEQMDSCGIRSELRRGFEMLSGIIGQAVSCSAVPGWKCTDEVLVEKQKFPFLYNSDCRGYSAFRPVVDGKCVGQPQVPVTLPTYDEIVGFNNITAGSFGDHILSLLREDRLNVFTVHAEVEGIVAANEFGIFLQKARAIGHEFCPLGAFINGAAAVPDGMISEGNIPGREGRVSVQGA